MSINMCGKNFAFIQCVLEASIKLVNFFKCSETFYSSFREYVVIIEISR